MEVITSPTDHPVEGIQPDIVQRALEVQEDAEVRRQQAAATWEQIQQVRAPGAPALRAWLLVYFHEALLLTYQEIAQAIGQPDNRGLRHLCGLLDEHDFPPGVTQEQAYQALEGLTYETIRQCVARNAARWVDIRPSAQAKFSAWRKVRSCLERRQGVTREDGRQAAIRFWLLWSLHEGSGCPWETISDIVRQIHKGSTQACSDATPVSGETYPPPDPRLHDKHRPPRVSWQAVGCAWAQVPTHQLTADALQGCFTAVLRYLQGKGPEEGHEGGEEHDESGGV
jgi:hypothetical protein